MGFLTPIVINNDTFHDIRQDPVDFVDAIARQMNDGGSYRDAEILRAQHADTFRLLAVGGDLNVRELSSYSQKLIDLYRRRSWMREIVRSDIRLARERLDELERALDEIDASFDAE